MEKSKERKFDLRSIDIRHYISVAITLGFIALGVFVFPNAICRLLESVRDFVISIARIFDDSIAPTVTELPSWRIKDSPYTATTLLPFEWEDFKKGFVEYWKTFASLSTLYGYFYVLGKVLFSVIYASLILALVAIPLYYVMKGYLKGQVEEPDDKQKGAYRKTDAKESKPLKIFKRISDLTYIKIRNFIISYVGFLKTYRVYAKIWLGLWLFYFNVITIVIEFFAFYLHFLKVLDLIEIYRYVYKLLLDGQTAFRFIPFFAWVIIAVVALEYSARKRGYAELNHRERMNRGMLNERPIVFGYDGTMGSGKTLKEMSSGLSYQVELRDRAFEVIVECDFLFPYFPWIKLERELKKASAFHVVYDIFSIRRWMRKKYAKWLKTMTDDKIFGYDYRRYGIWHNDKLKVESIWQVLEDYACAYFIYSVQCSLMISNYSIRSDEIMYDLGHFPLWNHDFFKRDARLMDAYSRRSHIVDFDMFRFGKKMLKGNPNAHALGFGVYLFTEWDKERKNDLALRENKVTATSDEANQKNDLTNTLLKMIRHAVTVRNRRFIVVIYDLQRAGDWGASGREIGEILHSVEETDMRPVLPFYAPFWYFEMFYSIIFSKFVNLYYTYRHVRSDYTLPMYVMHGFVAKVKHIYECVCNTFNSKRCTIEIENGNLSGRTYTRYQYISSMKDFSERYGSSCMEAVFERLAEKNKVGIMDLREYADKMAKDDELLSQHSYMQDDFHSDDLLSA